MLQRLQEDFRTALGKADAIRAKYVGAPGNMTADEEKEFEGYLAEADKLKASIEREQRAAELTRFLNDPVTGIQHPSQGETDESRKSELVTLQTTGFQKFLSGGIRSMSDREVRALQADNPAGGGYLVAPQQFVTELLANVKNMVYIRQMAREFQLVHAESLGVPTLDGDIDDADWTSELATGNFDAGLAFGKRELKPNPLAKKVKLSNKLIRQAALDPASIIRDRMAYKFAVSEEKAFLTGTGANQPLGVFTADPNGISTNADTVAANANSIVADDIINLKHDMKPQYWPKAVFFINRQILKAVRKLKDANNNYVWSTGLAPGGGLQGNAGTLVDQPYIVSEYAPSTISSGNYTMILGDFRHYWIADALDMQIQVLDQLYAEQNQTGYIGRRETDGMPVLEEAFRRLRH